MKTASRFGGQMPGGIFPHVQNNNVPQHTSQYQSSNSTGLPPPSFNHAFSQGSPNANPFAPTGNMNGLAGGFGPGTGFGAGGTGLASREAQEGFAHGAALQQQAARDQMRRTSGVVSKIQQKSRIRDVWRGNLAQEMQLLRELVEKYPYISMVGPFSDYVRDVFATANPTKSAQLIRTRIPNFPASLRDQWVPSPQEPTIITKLFDAT